MGWDTQYRPPTYDGVLGQEHTTQVLRQYVKEGKGFRQSYLFCGERGRGKTTTGRIFARALLCEAPVEGDPCDQCHSCITMLNEGAIHEGFQEFDAASNSGKEDLRRVVEDVTYSTFSGRRRIYLIDEAHRLSKSALDLLLKPTEDQIEGTLDKQLVVIFCTTDPGKMSSTIFSRCAPVFVIRAVPPEKIAERLAWVCDQEEVEYEMEALVTIAEVSGLHIRDALMTTEGVSMVGGVTVENCRAFLKLSANDLAVSLLEALGHDLALAVKLAEEISQEVGPSDAYERLSEAASCAYRTHLGVGRIPHQWNRERIQALSIRGQSLLGVAGRFSTPPHRPSSQTLMLDVGTVHYSLLGGISPSRIQNLVLEVRSDSPTTVGVSQVPEDLTKTPPETGDPGIPSANECVAAKNAGGVWVDPRGIGAGPRGAMEEEPPPPPPRGSISAPGALSPHVFRELLHHHMHALDCVP